MPQGHPAHAPEYRPCFSNASPETRLNGKLPPAIRGILLFLLLSLAATPAAGAEDLFSAIPGADKVSFLKTFVTRRVQKTGDAVVVKGELNGRPVDIVQSLGQKDARFELVPEDAAGLALPDVIPDLAGFPGMTAAAFQKLVIDETALTATTSLALENTPFTFTCDLRSRRVTLLAGGNAGLGLLVPALRDAPVVNAFSFQSLTGDLATRTLAATGVLNNAQATCSIDASGGMKNLVLDLKAAAPIRLGDVLPDLAQAPVVNEFSFLDLNYQMTTRTLSATGAVVKAAVTASIDAAGAPRRLVLDLKAAKDPIRLGDVLPDLADAPVSRDFACTDLTYDTAAKTLAATGLVNRAKLTASIDAGRGLGNLVLDLKAADHPLALKEVIPELGGIPIVDQFTFEDLRCTPSAKTVAATGKLVNAAAFASLDAGQGMKNLVLDLHAAKAAIGLGDLLPVLRDTPVVNDFTFVDLRYTAASRTLAATGKVNDAEMTAAIDVSAGAKNPALSLTATRGAVTLGDFIPVLAEVPGVSLFALEGLSYKEKTLSAEASFGSARADLSLRFPKPDSPQVDLKPRDSSLDLAKLLPDLANLPGIGDFHLVDMAYDEARKSLSALVRIGSASATLLLDREKSGKKSGNVFKLTSKDLRLGDLVSSLRGAPGLASLAFDELAIGLGSIEAKIDIAGRSATLVENLGKGFAALELGALDAAALVPKAGGTVLDGLKLSGSLFLFMKNAATLSQDDFPEDSRGGLSGIDFTKPFKAGVNLLAQINPSDLGKLKAPLSRLGLAKGRLPLRGMLPDGIFSYLTKALDHDADQSKPAPADTGGLLPGISLGIAVAPPQIPGVEKFATFDRATVVVTGDLGDSSLWGALPAPLKQYKPKGEVDISLQGGMTLALGGFKEDMAALLDLNVADKGGALSLLAVAKNAWANPFGIKGLTLKNGGYVLTLAGDSSGAKADLGFFGTAKLRGADSLAVSAAFEEAGGPPALKYFELAGPVTLADLAPDIPHGDACILRDIKIQPNGVEAVAELKLPGFDSRYALFLFDMKTATGTALVAALDLNGAAHGSGRANFSLGALAKAAGLKHKSAASIQSHLDGMAVANAALVLSSKQIFPVTVDQLRDGVAKDLFTRIFGKTQVPVKVDNVTFLSDFRADLMGEVGKKLTRGAGGVNLGLDGSAVINGAVGGLFDADPLSLDLEILLAGGFSLDHLERSGLKLPKFMKAKPSAAGAGVKDGLFLKVLDDTFEIGLLSGFDVTLNKTAFDFTGTLGVQLAEEDIGLSLSGAMSDTWQNALGIKGFALENVAVSGEIEDGPPPSLKLGVGGESSILGHDFTVAADASLGLAGEIPIPDGLGMKTAVSQLDVEAYKIMGYLALGETALTLATDPADWPIIVGGVALEVALAEGGLAVYDAVKGKKLTFGDMKKAPLRDAEKLMDGYAELEAWLLGGKDVYVSFATPGASDVNLGIPDGIHFSGDIQLFGGALKSPRIHPDITWIYKIAQAIASARKDVKKDAQGAGKDARKDAGKARKDPGKARQDIKGDMAAAARDLAALRDIVGKELGLVKKDISASYPKPSRQDVQAFLDSLRFKAAGAFSLGGIRFHEGANVTLIPFSVKTRATVLGAEQDVELALRNGSLAMALKTTLGGICETDLVFEYDRGQDDFRVIADLKSNPALGKWLDNEIREGVQQIRSTAQAKFDALNRDLAAAQQARDAAEKDLAAAQKAATAVTKEAVARLQQTTDNYQHDYEYAQSQYNNCSGWKKKFCQAKWWPRKGLAWDTWQASLELLDDAKKALAEEKALEADVHAAQIKFDQAANTVALALKDVAAAEEIADILADGLEHFVQNAQRAGGLFSLDQAMLAGSSKDLAKGQPLVLDLFFTIDGRKYEEFFAVSPADAAFNALSFGLLPVIVAERVVEDLDKTLEQKLAPKFGAFTQSAASQLNTWIQAHIYELIGGTRENLENRIKAIQQQLAQEEGKYKKVFASLEKHAGAFSPGYQALADTANQILATYKMTDFMPRSAQLSSRYLAVGHSALCLGVASNGVDVYQQNCKDRDTEQWTTAPLMGADGKDTGYVQLKSKGLCLKAKGLDPASGQLLALAQCNGQDEHEKWRVVSRDGLYSKIVNRFSQKCLHFDTENANAKSGYAVWTSCLGADSQAFRVLEDAEKPAFYPVRDEIKSNAGACLAPDDHFDQYFRKTAKGFATASRDDHAKMQSRRHDLLFPATCDGKAAGAFNYVENPDGTLKLVHAASGWCVTADRARGNSLVLAPCDKDKDMFWRTRDDNGDAFALQHESDGLCLDLPAGNARSGPAPESGAARVTPCRRSASQYIIFTRN